MLNANYDDKDKYTEKVTEYDKNGNIKKLQRYGNALIDNLTYTYNGNQLTKVKDESGNASGFTDGASAANEYTYDHNGNLTKDSNKNISSIAYNVLNLPQQVTFSDGSTIYITMQRTEQNSARCTPSVVLPPRRITVRMWSMKMASKRCC